MGLIARVAALVAVAATVASCGGGDAEPEATSTPTVSPTTAAPKAPATTDAPPAAAGTPAPEALSRFRCEKISSGWAAAGYVANTTRQKATFQVTVYIGPADGADHAAVVKQLPNIAAGGSVDFRIDKIPVAGEGDQVGDCHVQVLRLDG